MKKILPAVLVLLTGFIFARAQIIEIENADAYAKTLKEDKSVISEQFSEENMRSMESASAVTVYLQFNKGVQVPVYTWGLDKERVETVIQCSGVAVKAGKDAVVFINNACFTKLNADTRLISAALALPGKTKVTPLKLAYSDKKISFFIAKDLQAKYTHFVDLLPTIGYFNVPLRDGVKGGKVWHNGKFKKLQPKKDDFTGYIFQITTSRPGRGVYFNGVLIGLEDSMNQPILNFSELVCELEKFIPAEEIVFFK